MAATAEQVLQLRRMVAEATEVNYSNSLLTLMIESYPLMDERGTLPYRWNTSTQPPTQVKNNNWIPTYDLNAAAADIWDEKAAKAGEKYDAKADGGEFKREQVFVHYQSMARYYRSRRTPTTMTLVKYPDEALANDFPWIANLAEEED